MFATPIRLEQFEVDLLIAYVTRAVIYVNKTQKHVNKTCQNSLKRWRAEHVYFMSALRTVKFQITSFNGSLLIIR